MDFPFIQCTDSGWIPERQIIATPIITKDHSFMMNSPAALKTMIRTIPVHSFLLLFCLTSNGEAVASAELLPPLPAMIKYSYAQIGAYRSLSRTSFIRSPS